jgi:hypothetical protein
MALKIPIVQLNSFSWVSSAHLSVLDSFSHDLEIGWCGGVRCQGDAENTKTSFNADAGSPCSFAVSSVEHSLHD